MVYVFQSGLYLVYRGIEHQLRGIAYAGRLASFTHPCLEGIEKKVGGCIKLSVIASVFWHFFPTLIRYIVQIETSRNFNIC